MQKTNCKV